MKIAVLMDPVHRLKAYKDSTVAMIKAAQTLGWSCAYFTQDDLYCQQGRAFAQVSSIKVIGDEAGPNWAEVNSLGEKALNEFDIILMRKDPPFDMEYI